MLSLSSVFVCVLIAFQRSAYLFRLSIDNSLRRWIQITYRIAMYAAAELPNLPPMESLRDSFTPCLILALVTSFERCHLFELTADLLLRSTV